MTQLQQFLILLTSIGHVCNRTLPGTVVPSPAGVGLNLDDKG